MKTEIQRLCFRSFESPEDASKAVEGADGKHGEEDEVGCLPSAKKAERLS